MTAPVPSNCHTTRRLLTAYLLVGAAVVGVWWATEAVGGGLAATISAILLSLVLLVTGLGWLLHIVRPIVALEHRLAALAPLSGSELNDGPLQLEPVVGQSSAAFGWNRLAEQCQLWSALSELKTTLLDSMSDRRRGTGPQLLDSLSEGVATVDAAGRITYANAALASMCGQSNTDNLLGTPLGAAFGVAAETADAWHQTATNTQTVFEWTTPSSSGGDHIFRGQRRPGRKSDGGNIAFVWTIRDITQQKLADTMRDQFLATATHEFRTPLANIRAYAESLDMSDDLDPESRKRFYNVIQSESLRLSQLVDDLLDISRMQAGAMSLDCRETDLGRLVEEISQKVAAEMAEKSLDYRCELPPKYPKLSVDKGKLAAAIINLLGNAAKYTPTGGRVTFRVDVNSRQIEFAVTDSGIGISAEDLPRVFERFYRCSDDRVREITGSGLGLALTQEVARLHGGDVSVESQLNQGSTFRITLPLDATAA
jgi:PAS domain S-box-containing protein